VLPRWGQTALLPSVIGIRCAMQMMRTGAYVAAEVAFEWGIVNEICNVACLLDRCLEIAGQIVGTHGDSIAAQLRALRQIRATSLEQGLEVERRILER
jgi:enoyl-CoA hydratase/carnithine racemase